MLKLFFKSLLAISSSVVTSLLMYVIVLVHFYFNSNLPIKIVTDNIAKDNVFFYLLSIPFLLFLIILPIVYFGILIIMKCIYNKLTTEIYQLSFILSIVILILAAFFTFLKMSLFTPFFSQLYLEIYDSPKVFKSQNGHYYTVFDKKDNLYEVYDLNKSLDNSSMRCKEILKKNELPSGLIYQLINKQTDDNYTIPYNISEIDANLTQIEFNDALSSIQSHCRERGE